MMRNIPYAVHRPEIVLKKEKPSEVQNDVKYNQLVHDLKSPVHSLKGIISFADSQVKDEQVKEYFYMIRQCVDKLEEKISNTLNMFNHGSDNADLSEIDFNALLQEVHENIRLMDGIDQVKLDVEVSDVDRFFSVKPLVESVLQNLIENAVKYRNKKISSPMVKVIVSGTSDGVRIEVADNGIGISEKNLPHIFSASFKGILEDKGSNGLGLFLVKKAVEKMHGTIEVHSREGRGTIFTVDLPNNCDRVNYVGLEEGELVYE